MSSLCTLAGYSRQAFYSFEKHHAQAVFEEDLIIQEVLRHRKLQPRLGVRKLLVLLQDFTRQHHIKLGRDALFDLLRAQDLLIRKRKRKVQTTFSRHPFKKYKNLIAGYEPLAPNLLWVSDITYVCVADGFVYLSLITDAFSKKVVGYYLSETLEASGSLKALQKALRGCKDASKLIHHSDRGIQYCSMAYVKTLKQHAIQISMTEHGDPLENAIAERVNGILKEELLQTTYKNFKAAAKSVEMAIFIYNSLRPHSSCDMLTPREAHLREGRLKKHWKNYYKQKEVAMDST